MFGEVASGDGFGDGSDGTDLIGEVGGEDVDDVGEFTPGAVDVEDEGLATEFTGDEGKELVVVYREMGQTPHPSEPTS